jgi:predicted nuclease with TOPRIM domain
MPRETKAQKNARVGALLADYDEKSRQLRKLEGDLKDMKDRIRELAEGQYGEWIFTYGTPREILDQAQVQKDYAEQGWEVPKTETRAPIVVKHVAATSGKR